MQALSFLLSPSSFLCLWASLLGILPCHCIAPTISLPLFYFLLPMGLQADVSFVSIQFPYPYLFWALLANISTVSAHFLHPYLFWALRANIPAMPIHFIHRAFSTHLLILYLFYSHRFLLNPLGFLDPITTSLLLITFRAYWPLSQPNEFTNSFLGLPRPIDFFVTSYCSHGFTTSLLGLPRPIYFLFTSYYSCELAGHYSCHSSLLSLFYYFLFSFSSYCWASSAIGSFVKKWASTKVDVFFFFFLIFTNYVFQFPITKSYLSLL